MLKSMVGELQLVEAMHGVKFIAQKMMKTVVVVSSVYPVYGVHQETQ